jgi:hypothetical protein
MNVTQDKWCSGLIDRCLDPGDWAAWVSALVGSTAVIVSAVAVFFAARAASAAARAARESAELVGIERERFKNEQAARQEAEQRERRRQAEAVYYKLDPADGTPATRDVYIRNESNAPVDNVVLLALTCDPHGLKPIGDYGLLVKPVPFGADEVEATILPWKKDWKTVLPSAAKRSWVRVGLHGANASEGEEGPRVEWHPRPAPFVPDWLPPSVADLPTLEHSRPRTEWSEIEAYFYYWRDEHPNQPKDDYRALYEYAVTNLPPYAATEIVTGFELEFTDIHDVQWVLDKDGRLTQVSKPRSSGDSGPVRAEATPHNAPRGE